MDQVENLTKNPFFFVEVIADSKNPLLISNAVQALNPWFGNARMSNGAN